MWHSEGWEQGEGEQVGGGKGGGHFWANHAILALHDYSNGAQVSCKQTLGLKSLSERSNVSL